MKDKDQINVKIQKNKELVHKLVNIGNNVIAQLKDFQNPNINIPVRSLSNVYFDEKARLLRLGNTTSERSYFNLSQSKSFMQTMLVASKLREVIERGSAVGLRQLFYLSKGGIPGTKENTFDLQKECDPIVEDIEGVLKCLREEMGVEAERKGILAGDLKILDSGDEIDCSKLGSSGYGIPSIVEKGIIDFIDCKAEFILVVEKGQTWSTLNHDKFWKKNKCLVLTGKGQPARGDRRMLARLHRELDLPVYIFTDMDIWGYYIYSVFKQGSINLAHFSENAAVPDAKFLGFKMSDVEKYKIPKEHLIPMNKGDYKRIKEISNYDWFKKNMAWQKEFKALTNFANKIEQDALVGKGLEFMSRKYLPEKIETRDWID
jgi:DNA topoisomerase VI subunit A